MQIILNEAGTDIANVGDQASTTETLSNLCDIGATYAWGDDDKTIPICDDSVSSLALTNSTTGAYFANFQYFVGGRPPHPPYKPR